MNIAKINKLPQKEGKEYLDKHNKVLVNVIFTFAKGPQLNANYLIPRKTDEQKFLNIVIKGLKNKKDLVKISVCQLFTTRISDLLPFVKKSGGKFYFKNGTQV